jgi:hypothetical protein
LNPIGLLRRKVHEDYYNWEGMVKPVTGVPIRDAVVPSSRGLLGKVGGPALYLQGYDATGCLSIDD